MPKDRNVVRGVASNWVALGCTLVVGFFLSPFVVHRLGNVYYGVWILATSVVSYMSLLDLGLRGAVTRFVSRGYTLGKHLDSSRAVSAALWLRLWISLVIALGSVLLASLAPRLFLVPPEVRSTVRLVIILTGSSLAVTLLSGVFGGVLAALQRFDLLSALSITQTITRAAGVLWLLSSGRGIVGLAVWELTVAIAAGFALIAICFRAYPELQLFLRRPEGEILRKLWSYSIYIFVINIAIQAIHYTDNLVVGAFVSAQAVTFFAIGGGLIEYLRQLVASLTATFMPLASSFEADGKQEHLRRLLIQGTRVALLIALAVGLTLFFRGPTFIGLWMGNQYASVSGRVLRILLLAQFFAIANYTSANIAYGLHKHRPVALWSAVEAAANLCLSLLLVRRIGIEGVAWGTTIPALLIHVLFWPRYICRTLAMPLREYTWQSWIRPAMAAIPFGAACYLADHLWPAKGLLNFFMQTGLLLPVFVLCVGLTFWQETNDLWRRWAPSFLAKYQTGL